MSNNDSKHPDTWFRTQSCWYTSSFPQYRWKYSHSTSIRTISEMNFPSALGNMYNMYLNIYTRLILKNPSCTKLWHSLNTCHHAQQDGKSLLRNSWWAHIIDNCTEAIPLIYTAEIQFESSSWSGENVAWRTYQIFATTSFWDEAIPSRRCGKWKPQKLKETHD